MMRLEEVCGGALQEKFQNSLNKVMENLQDENVPYNTKREILIKLTFKQNKERDNVLMDVKVTEKLASQGELCTCLSVERDGRTGDVVVEEYGDQLRGQIGIEEW